MNKDKLQKELLDKRRIKKPIILLWNKQNKSDNQKRENNNRNHKNWIIMEL